MNVLKIKTKPIMEYAGTGAIAVGKKIIIHTDEKQDLTISEESKIIEFFKTLRS